MASFCTQWDSRTNVD